MTCEGIPCLANVKRRLGGGDTESGLSTPMTNGRRRGVGEGNRSEPSASTLVGCALDDLAVARISDLAREGKEEGKDDSAGVGASVEDEGRSSESDEGMQVKVCLVDIRT